MNKIMTEIYSLELHHLDIPTVKFSYYLVIRFIYHCLTGKAKFQRFQVGSLIE